MANEIISVSIPQCEKDLDWYEAIRVLLIAHGFEEIDMSIEQETNNIRYRFQLLLKSTC